MTVRDKILSAVYIVWAVVAVGLALLVGGLSSDNITRLAIIAFLALQLVGSRFARGTSRGSPRVRFVVSGMALAAAIEGFYMISRPAFPSLRIGADTDLVTGLEHYAIDLGLTLPAYLVIFLVIWRFITRYRFTLWEYILAVGTGQALGDGFVYFAAAPAMLLFLPYVLLNYHAMNIAPFLAVRDQLPETVASPRRFLVVPALVVVYLACGAAIASVGSLAGLE